MYLILINLAYVLQLAGVRSGYFRGRQRSKLNTMQTHHLARTGWPCMGWEYAILSPFSIRRHAYALGSRALP